MLNHEEIKKLAQETLKTDLSGVEIIDADEVYVSKKGGKATVGGKTIPQKLRALSLLAINKDKDECEIHQKPVLDGFGMMSATSQGGAMRVDVMKQFIFKTALAGADRYMLYMDDTYKLDGYPHFGYLNGAYSDDELREIDDFAYSIGVEVIPAIQTLGHLGGYLCNWSEEVSAFHDKSGILMCDSDETMRLIEAMISKMRSLFRTKRLNIGLDEVHDLGFGQYYDKNGYKDRYETFNRHLLRVIDICKKYDFKPMMWSDSIFNLGLGEGSYYLLDAKFPEKVVSTMPEIDLLYWDYYTLEQSEYEQIIANHRQLNCNVIYAGAGRTETGGLVDITGAFKATVPGMKASINTGVKEAWCTLWGAYPRFGTLYSFAAYSELCYNPDATEEDFDKMGSLLSGIPTKTKEDMNKYFELVRFPLSYIWCDPLHNVTGKDFNEDTKYLELPEVIAGCEDEVVRLYLNIVYTKLSIYANLQKDYKAGKDLSKYVNEILPKHLEDYKRLCKLDTALWLKINKPFGVTNRVCNFYKMYGRIEYMIGIIDAYVKGETDRIEDLDYEPIYGMPKSGFQHG